MANEIPTGGGQAGGGPGKSDQAAPGGSSGEGGYGQDPANADGGGDLYGGAQSGYGSGQDLDRGAAFDAQQGGGRSSDDVDDDESPADKRDAEQTAQADAFLADQQSDQEHVPSGVDAGAGS